MKGKGLVAGGIIRRIRHIFANMDRMKGEYDALMRCADKSTVSHWRRAIDVLESLDGFHKETEDGRDLSQPSRRSRLPHPRLPRKVAGPTGSRGRRPRGRRPVEVVIAMGKLKNAGEWLWGLAIAPLTMLGLTVYSLFLSLLAAPLFAIYMVFVGAVLLSLFGLWWSLTSLFPVLEGYGELALILALPLSLVLLPWIADRKKRSSTLWRWLWTRE